MKLPVEERVADRLKKAVTKIRAGGYTRGTQERLIAKAHEKAERDLHSSHINKERQRHYEDAV